MGLADKAMDKVKLMAAALRAQFQVEGLIPTRWRWCPKQPSPKQQVLLAGDYHEAFYGGAAGGGKTALLLMAALKYVDHPQYRALILRRTYSALEQPRGVIEQSKEWLQGTGAEYAQKRYEWNFPSGAQIKFGQIRHNGDLEKYQGGGYHFCVGGDTPVLLADGTYKAMREVQVGDSLMTLEGSRKVTRTIPVRRDQCVRADTYDSSGKLVGSQVQSVTHSVLTTCGWVAYRDTYDVSRLSEFSLSIQSDFLCKSSLLSGSLSLKSLRMTYGLSGDRRQPFLLTQSSVDLLDHEVLGACLKADRSDSLEFGDEHRSEQPSQVLSYPVLLHSPSQSSHPFRLYLPGEFCEALDVGRVSLAQDSLVGYRPCRGLYDEPLRYGLDISLPDLPLPTYAEKPYLSGQHLDGRDSIHEYNRGACEYTHPYTKERRTVSGRPLAYGTLILTPIGIQDVYDITVDEVSHYITSSKLVNQNCGFDEVTQFSEYQYTYLFSRMRKDMDSLDIPLRIYSGSNPSHTAKWVYNYFIKKAIKEGDFTYFAQHVNDVGDTWSSVYVPARLEDNPGIDQESYRKSLAHLDPVLRAQLLSGDWNIMPQGDIYPYKEPHQVITMSEFANMYQDDHIPKDWFISMALDWGASKTSTTAGTWIATSAKRTMLPDRKFIFREKDWLKPTEPKVAREIIDIESVRGEAKRIQHRVISHDAATERRSFNEYYGLKFQSAIHSVLSGISVVRYHMDLHYLDLPHPFRPALNGQPFIYLLVPDDQGTCYRREIMNEDDLSPWIVDQAIDHDGLIDHRSAFASYAWDESGKAPVKGFGWDNIMDAVRMCAWKSFAMPRTYTKTEREDEKLRPELRTETLWNAYEKVRKEDLDKAVHLLNNDMLNRQMELAIMGIIKKKSSKSSGTKPWQLPFGQR